MTSAADSPSPPDLVLRAHEGPVADPPDFVALRTYVAERVDAQAPAIVARWVRQVRGVAPHDEQAAATLADATDTVNILLRTFCVALSAEGAASDDGVAIGLAFGMEAFDARVSLHHMLKALDLLVAMALYALETTLGDAPTTVAAAAADGVRLCRRMQEAASLVSLAATRGYTQAMSDGMRDRFRHLRHDLRNPLGTIKSVLALMDDESVPAADRAHPRFRAMAERNARSLDELIVARLSDAASLFPALAQQRVSLRVVACAVRRDLRREAEERETTVVVGEARERVWVDAVSVELLLHAALLAALQESQAGDELLIDFEHDASADRVNVLLARLPARPALVDPSARERLTALAGRIGTRLAIGTGVALSVAVRRDADGIGAGGVPAVPGGAAAATPAVSPTGGPPPTP